MTSTNDKARELVATGAASGTVVVRACRLPDVDAVDALGFHRMMTTSISLMSTAPRWTLGVRVDHRRWGCAGRATYPEGLRC